MYFCINGGRKLGGEIGINSAKNSVLPIIACCIMAQKQVVIKNCPPLKDVVAMTEIIASIGGVARFFEGDLYVDCSNAAPKAIEDSLTRPIRSSVFILGALLSRFKTAKISYPGGCEIGSRPIDIHLDALKSLGAVINTSDGVIECDGENLKGGDVHLRFPSVGATENLIMAAALTKGKTIIHNAAREPEIIDLADFVNFLGGKVFGAGSPEITIEGVAKLGGGEYTPIPDRIVAGTYLAAAAVTGGKIRLINVRYEHIYSIIDKFQQAGCRFNYKKNSLTMTTGGSLSATQKTVTMPYPGFPTDMQPQLTAMMASARGVSVITENLFDARFKYAGQLKKMGADIEISGNQATVNGIAYLKGATVEAHDLRGGAALIIAALGAQGASTVHGAEHIDRGYYKIEDDLSKLNADIIRKN